MRIELDSAGIVEVLKSPEVAEYCTSLAETKRAEAGEGYILSPHMGAKRFNVKVVADSKNAAEDNLDNNTLLKTMGAM